MKCMYCNGELIKTKDVFHVDRKNIHLTIDDIEVYKCEVCNEVMLDAKEVEKIQEALVKLEEALNKKVA
ncbi:YgiT-type zinc finger protein [Calditrichota bacterium GD2]